VILMHSGTRLMMVVTPSTSHLIPSDLSALRLPPSVMVMGRSPRRTPEVAR